jgi:periplasmic divalent cation tolerance protein
LSNRETRNARGLAFPGPPFYNDFMTGEYAVILITVGSRAEAEALSSALLARRAAACVNTLPGVTSSYLWQGKLETDAELLLIVKTRRALIPAVNRIVRELHSYDVPEVIALPIIGGSPDYLNWLDEVTAKDDTEA